MSNSKTNSLRSTIDTIEERLRTGVSRSRVAGIGRTLVRYVRHSWLYRWLTHEPEPDVIVIDLRETYTVGPIIRILDRLFEQFSRATDSSKTVTVIEDVEHQFRHRPLQVSGVLMLAAVSISAVIALILGRLDIVMLVGHGALAVLSGLGLRSERTLEDLTEMRAWKVLVAAFEPPKPPDTGSVDSSSGEPESDEERR